MSARATGTRLRHLLGLALLVLAGGAVGADIELRLPSFNSGAHQYYHRLLDEALAAKGHRLSIVSLPDIPQTRRHRMLETGELSLQWMLQTSQRDAAYPRVDHALTAGLIAQRVLLVPPGEEARYARVQNLAELQASKLVGGLGKDWFDAEVWQHNRLSVFLQDGDWRPLHKMVAARNRGIDYFPRGVIEVLPELRQYPGLVVEPRLLLVYDRDFMFYLSPATRQLKPVLEEALREAERSGLQQRLLQEHFGADLARLQLERRVRILLTTPNGL